MDFLLGGSYRRSLIPISGSPQGVQQLAERLERLNGD
jgi:hypothetical protein